MRDQEFIKKKGEKIMTKRFGFTLAEVLITLGIIGVVAAMTMPTLMNSTQGAQYKTAYKKALSLGYSDDRINKQIKWLESNMYSL